MVILLGQGCFGIIGITLFLNMWHFSNTKQKIISQSMTLEHSIHLLVVVTCADKNMNLLRAMKAATAYKLLFFYIPLQTSWVYILVKRPDLMKCGLLVETAPAEGT
eukprot:Lithocolla_globosa_v1_NODE_100_length_6365_cov_5.402377.p6 type:complete len:106 gc:universal NODE_100_length_6365_cov_5.402377:5874-6191(+)